MNIHAHALALKLAQSRIQALQREAHVARLERQQLRHAFGVLSAGLTAAVHFKAAARPMAACCPS